MTGKSDAELAKLLVDTRIELRGERFAAAGARAKDSSTASKLRAVVARVLTEQSRRFWSAARPEASGHASAHATV